MKTLFEIQSEREISDEHSLLMEIGKDHCSFAFLHQPSNVIDRLQFLSYQETEEENFSHLLSGINERGFKSVYVCSAFPQSILVPSKYFNNDYQMLDQIYDQPAQEYFHDKIPEWQLVNVYSLPTWIHQSIQQAFPEAEYCHAYTPNIKVYNGYVADHQLMVHFTPNYFRVILKKSSAIQLAQTYSYTTPLDVVYFLLKICYEFNLEQSSVYLILSGLIDKDSSLYSELEQYFVNVHFAHPPEIRLPENNYPHYFFTSIYNLATCVS